MSSHFSLSSKPQSQHWVLTSCQGYFWSSHILLSPPKVLINRESLKAGNRSFSPILVFLEDTEFSRGNILEYKSSVQQTLTYSLFLVPMDYVGEGNATTMLDTHISTREVRTHIFPNARVRIFDSLRWLFWNNRDIIYLLHRIQLY